jgi:hypothetical protein
MQDTYRITALEDKTFIVPWYETITSGTTGTLTLPTGGTLVLNQWSGSVSAKCSTITITEKPTGISAKTSAGVDITVTISSNGAWALSGTPSAYPVAIVYYYQVKLFYFNSAYSLDTVGAPNIHLRQHAITDTNDHTSTATSGQMLKADASGLPVNATNTDTQVSDAVQYSLTGFVNRTDSTLGMSGASFQVTTGTSYVFYSEGKKYTKTTTQEVTISNDNTMHYVYFDNDGVLTVSTDVWGINTNKVLVAMVYKTGAAYAIFDERHSFTRNRHWHSWAHYTIGARYYSGFTGTFTDTTLSVTQGTIEDEDIIIDSGGTKTACRLWYRNSGAASMTFESNVTTPYKIVTGAIKYDNAGTLTSVDNNYYVCSYVYATNDKDYPIAVVVGQAQYAGTPAGLDSARAEAVPTVPGGVLIEWKLLYQVIYHNPSGTPDYIEANDKRTVSTGPAGTVTSGSHAALVDRSLPNSHPASAITNTPAGTVSATDVQSAIDELASEKLAITSLVLPFYVEAGTIDTIPLTADSKLPFFDATATAKNIALTT